MKIIFSFILIVLSAGCNNLPKPAIPTAQPQVQVIVVTATPELVPTIAPELPTDTSLLEQIVTEEKAFDSEAFIAYLKENGFPIGNVVVYTEETDPNKFLGRPNQYISKLNFSDTTLSPNADNLNGGGIEVFKRPSRNLYGTIINGRFICRCGNACYIVFDFVKLISESNFGRDLRYGITRSL